MKSHQGGKEFSSKFTLQVEGLKEMFAEIEKLGPIGLMAARDAMTEKAQEIKAKSIPLIPDDPGTPVGVSLHRAIRVAAPRTAGLRQDKPIVVSVIVGGRRLEKVKGKRQNVLWPLIQHEDLTLKHTKGQAKFLEIPGNAVAPSVPDAILAKIDAYKHKFASVIAQMENDRAIAAANRPKAPSAG